MRDMNRGLLLSTAICLFVLTNCTEEQPLDPAPAVSRADLTRRWGKYCETSATECRNQGDQSETDCERTRDCYTDWWRPEVADVYLRCMQQDLCEASDDDCAAEARASAGVTEAGMRLDRMCRARREACGGSFKGAGDSGVCHAGLASVLLDDQIDAFLDCLEQPCDQVAQCVREARPAPCNG